MTRERKRALVLIVTTFIIGLAIGALAVGLMNRQRGGGRKGSIGWRDGGRERFIQKVLQVVEADSTQAKQMRPHIVETMKRIDSLQSQTDHQVRAVVDSFEVKLEPILSDQQMEGLKRFHQRGRKAKGGKHSKSLR